jgi:hypothetical protein
MYKFYNSNICKPWGLLHAFSALEQSPQEQHSLEQDLNLVEIFQSEWFYIYTVIWIEK